MPSTKPRAADPENQPGYYIRRLQQIAVAIFMEETQAQAITPVQYAALYAAERQPGMDQRSLAATIGFDTSTIGGVVDRLEARGWLERRMSPEDRRARQLFLTPEGAQGLAGMIGPMLRAQEQILAPLSTRQRADFMRLLQVLVTQNNALSRAPGEAAR